MIKDNVENVRNRIRAAQEASPYREEVRLVGVSKFREIRELDELVEMCIRDSLPGGILRQPPFRHHF